MKTVKNITKKLKEAKKVTHDWEDFLCTISFKQKPVNEAFLEKFAIEWCQAARADEEYIYLLEYPMKRGVSRHTLERWKQRDENVMNAYKEVKEICAMRREVGAAKRKLDGNFIARNLAFYSDDWKEMEKWHAELKSKNDGASSGERIVVLERFPETNVVPRKNDDEKNNDNGASF